MKWSAQWIWHPPLERMSNFYLYARRQFQLDAVPPQVNIAVTAGSLYKLYINGEYVGRGPNPSDPSRYYYDVYEVSALLRPGENVIAAVCYNYGPTNEGCLGQNWGRGGFLLEMRKGDKALLVTDGTWKVLQAPEWDQAASLNCNLYGDYKEIYDSRREIIGWMGAGFDDSGWVTPEVLGKPPVEPYTRLVEREIPALGGEYVYPENVYWESASLTYSWRNDWEVYHEDQLMLENPSSPVEIRKTHEDFSPSIICDYGRDVTGYPEIHIRESKGGVIDVLYGEDLHMVRVDRFILKGGSQVLRAFNRRTFRYMKMLFVETPGQLLLDKITMRMNTYPVKYVSSFSCSDDLLNRIWEVSRYTIHMSMLDHFVDCPWRERTIYGGDVYAENLHAYYAFGDPRLNRKTLRQMFALQYPEGALPPYGPYSGCDGFYSSWTAFFALAFADHYQLTGDREFLEEGWPHLTRILEWAIKQMKKNGNYLMGSPERGGKFDGWKAKEKVSFSAWDNLPFYMLLMEGAELATVQGDSKAAARYHEAADLQIGSMYENNIDPENSWWHSIVKGEKKSSNQIENAYLLWSGVLDDASALRVAHELDYKELRPIDSPFHGLFVLMGLFRNGADNQALRFIREYWGSMLARGATNFYEHFTLASPQRLQPGRGTSLNHGWSAAPVYALPAYVLGVTPLTPGFQEVAIDPQPGDLAWARGDVPTPLGLVHVDWTRSDRQFHLRVNLPEGLTGRVSLPALPPHLKVLVDGKVFKELTYHGARPVFTLSAGAHEIVAQE